jgi:cytochrome c peroxidase
VDRPAGDELTPAKTALGERFFEDPRLSRGGRISCATCHAPASGFAERSAIAKPAGVTRTHRNSQSILNAGYRATLGWDGRFPSLEDQVKGSFSPWGDMGMDLPDAVTAVATDSSYVNGCRRAFNLSLNPECLARAIAAYERSLVRGDSPFDRYLFGGDLRALDARARAGWELFKGRAGCIACHDVFHSSTNDLGSSYALLSDERFHNLGVGYADGRMQDVGRYGVTKAFADFGAFKTPMLRNVADTPPYMHDGSLPMLYDVVTFYNRGGNPNPNLSPGLKPLHLSENEKLDLVAFLRSLSSPRNSPNISR